MAPTPIAPNLTVTEAIPHRRVAKIGESIQSFLGLQQAPVPEKTILSSVKGRKQLKIAALRMLAKDGKVLREGKGVKGDPFLYKLPEPVLKEVII